MPKYKPITGYPNYRVGDDGSIWSYRCIDVYDPRWRRVYRWKKLRTRCGRYPSVCLCRDGYTKSISVHTLVLRAFVGPCPEGMDCCHLDNNPQNCSLDNLMWDTPKNNQADRIRFGTHCRGENHASATLTMKKARRIRRLYATGKYTQIELAEMFRTRQSTVSSVVLHQSYKEYDDEVE